MELAILSIIGLYDHRTQDALDPAKRIGHLLGPCE